MNLDIYQTTVCKSYNLNKVYSQIKIELINYDNITDLKIEGENIADIKLLSGEAEHIPAFSHPIIVNSDERSHIIIDIRRLIRLNSSEIDDFKVTSKPDYDLLVLRARILSAAVKGNLDKLRDFDPLPATIFSRWVTNALAFKMNFTAHEQNVITVLTIAYYFKLFDPDLNVVELMLFINRNTYIDPDIISDIFQVENINKKLLTLAGLIEMLKEKISNIRIEKLSVALLLSSLTYGWRGNDAKETMAVCLEHPPTWIACLTTAIEDKNYRHSPIAKIVKNYTRNNKDKEFLMRIKSFLAQSEG